MKRIWIAALLIASIAQAEEKKTTGQNGFVFSWDKALTDAMPDDVRKVERRMHGGFNEDPKTGEVYTGMTGYGLCRISPDLTKWSKVGEDPRLASDIHGLEPFYFKDTLKRIAIAQNRRGAVLITDGEGKILQDVQSPKGTEFNFEPANVYYTKKGKFVPTDVSYMDGKLYVVTGYAPGDFVLTLEEKDGTWAWGSVAWGGKGTELGQFKTAHGVMARNGTVYVANRDNNQTVKFTKDGKNPELFNLPPKSRVCDVAYEAGHFFLCPLFKVTPDQKSAPIYAHTGEKVVSTIVPGDLGIPDLTNIHQAWPHMVKGKDGKETLYLLIHGWNKGKYAVLKHEGDLPAKAYLQSPRDAVNQLSGIYLGN